MKTNVKILYWTPRILCIMAILLISMFALDSFEPGLTIWQQIGAFLIHLIPTYILVGLLIVAWKSELIGGIVFLIIGIGLSPFIFNHNYHMNHSFGMSLGILLMVNFPFVAVDILFVLNHYIRIKSMKKTNSM